MIRVCILLAILTTVSCFADESEESIATRRPVLTIDGATVEEGELKLLIDASKVPDKTSTVARQAAAMVLVRQHLALASIRELGGDAIHNILQRELRLADDQAKAIGMSLQSIAKSKGVSLTAYRSHLTWQIAWREYLKSRLTDAALRTFFDAHSDRYGGREFLVSQIFAGHDDRQSLIQLAETLRADDDRVTKFTEEAEHRNGEAAGAAGYIGWVSRDGDLPQELMASLRKLEPEKDHAGTIVGPVRSSLGQHLLVVQETRRQQVSFESLTDQFQLRSDFAEALFLDLVARQTNADVRYLDSTLIKP